MDNKPLRILSASAGSGKTFNLAETYIRLLLSDPDPHAYRGILAVTFTNASTDDMKTKILQSLKQLADSPQESPYRDIFVPSRFASDEQLSKQAKVVLNGILHDYSSFAISTIDHFFQMVIHAFSREIGMFASYQVELDKASLIKESIDRVMEDIGSPENAALLKWLQNNILEAAQNGSGYNMDERLEGMAGKLLSEEHRNLMEKENVTDEDIYDDRNLARVKSILKGYTKGYVESVRKAAVNVEDAFRSCGIGMDETTSGFMNKVIQKYASDTYREIGKNDSKWSVNKPTDKVLEKAGSFETWWKKADKGKYARYEQALMPPFRDFVTLLSGDDFRYYTTAMILLDSLGELAISSRLRNEFMNLMQERNVLSLDDSNTFLRRIIDGSDAPFVYEKIGVRYKHYLMDEFQDTSRVQWENFRPLIANSMAGGPGENPENLLVGDVKQSIYRWRGADWRLMQSDVPSEFSDQLADCKPLAGNYRSLRRIVEFNNELFRHCSAERDKKCLDELKKPGGIKEIYGYKDDDPEAGMQKAMRTDDQSEGHVEVVICNPDKEMDEIVAAIRDATQNGARHGDIAVLTRKNNDSDAIASRLTAEDIPVISSDSLNLKNSLIIKTLTSLLNRIADPGSKVKSWFARGCSMKGVNFAGRSLPAICDALLLEIKSKEPDAFRSEAQYVQSFMDVLHGWMSRNGNDLPAFLSWWDDNESKLSTPSGANAVTVTTIHKSKGLEYPCVIIPFVEHVGSSGGKDSKWCCAPLEGTPLAEVGRFPAYIPLTERCGESLFKSDYDEEKRLSMIDDLNIMYVALTRAKASLTIIAGDPALRPKKEGEEAKSSKKGSDGFSKNLKDFAEKAYTAGKLHKAESADGEKIVYSMGTPYSYPKKNGESDQPDKAFEGDTDFYPLFPLNPIEVGDDGVRRERCRLHLRSDTSDFFRHRGIVIHDILSKVIRPEDLRKAVEAAVSGGELAESEMISVSDILGRAIAAHPEWFPSDGVGVMNETSIISADGKEHRPDRVVMRGGKVSVIDYKFGEKNARYLDQVGEYVSLLRQIHPSMDVSGFLWYLPAGEVVAV